ncbi:MAG: phospho-N-acetylmuramoyl-pentapeptide-transferase [Lachnospiraceae bacterium]|nr:phospho-N-acetylmuramoyl-pentapeptide-transferase [Lachnospiraceae bacterium]
MLSLLIENPDMKYVAFFGVLFAFLATGICLKIFGKYLPLDGGRDFAVDGKKSQGKPRGAGLVFILIFALAGLFFVPFDKEIIVYIILVVAAMFTGYLDDAAKTPWGEYKKGLLDLLLAVLVALNYLTYNPASIEFMLFDMTVTIQDIVFGILVVILVWASINVTNCADGVDGLSGTLTMITLLTIYGIYKIKGDLGSVSYLILLFCVCILGYLWYNANPSRMLMGDAGSRAMGIFIAIAILKTGSPVLYIPVAIVLILDGGLGLVKVALLRFLKIKILKNTRTPLHDHTRKNMGWSGSQTVVRFAIIQIMVSLATLYLIA